MRRIAQILIIVFIAIFIIPFFLPNTINVSVERDFKVQAGMIFEDFNNLNEFSKWEPWTYNDTTAQKNFFSPYRGEGAGYSWNTKNKNGTLTITKSQPTETIEYNLEGFDLGRNSQMKVFFETVDSATTKVKWEVSSEKLNYFSRYFAYFTSQNLVSKLESGFENLENYVSTAVLTTEQAQALKPGDIKIENFEGKKLIAIHNLTSLENEELRTAVDESLGEIYSYLVDYKKVNPNLVGKAIIYFDKINIADDEIEFYSGYPIVESVEAAENMELFAIEANQTLVCIHQGSYETLAETITEMKTYAKNNNINIGHKYWEEIIIVPNNDNNTQPQIKVYFPIQS